MGELHAQVDGVINSAIGDIKEAIESLSAERVHAFIVKLSEVLMDNPAVTRIRFVLLNHNLVDRA